MDCMESPFNNVLHSTYVPAENEITQLKALIAPSVQALARIDEEIAKLSARRQELDNFVSAHRALSSPMRRLPLEVLTEIFWHCLPTTHYPVCLTLEPPLLFGQVCRRWREASLATPRLWSAIHIVVPSATIEAKRAGVRAWLARSGSLPLSIALRSSSSNASDARLFLEDITELYRRWWKIDISFPSISQEIKGLSNIPGADMSLLESFYVHECRQHRAHLVEGSHIQGSQSNDNDRSYLPWPLQLKFLKHAPRLRDVAIRYILPQVHTLDLPWTQLAHLTLECGPDGVCSITVHQAINILFQCRLTLESCALSVQNHAYEFFASSPPDGPTPRNLLLPRLHKLCIRISGSSGDLYNRLEVPSLKELKVEDNSSPQPLFLPQAMLMRSACPLESLEISVTKLTDSALSDLLLHLPTITTLRVSRLRRSSTPMAAMVLNTRERLEVSARFMEALTTDQSPRVLCPALQHVSFVSCSFSDFAALRMFESRMKSELVDGMAQMLTAHVTFAPYDRPGMQEGMEWSSEMVDAIRERIHGLRQKGLCVSFRYHNTVSDSILTARNSNPWEGIEGYDHQAPELPNQFMII